MIAIVETATGTVEAIVESLDGVDMAGRHSIALPEGYDPIAVSHVLVDGEWQPNVDAAWARLRAERPAKLGACDWTVLPDLPDTTRLGRSEERRGGEEGVGSCRSRGAADTEKKKTKKKKK